MGEFSFTKADGLTKVCNIVYDAPFKLLIPQEFGGGFVKDYYQGFGRLGHRENGEYKYDIHEVLAFWNRDMLVTAECARLADLSVHKRSPIHNFLQFDGSKFPVMKEVDKYTQANRTLGIGLFHDKGIMLRYPIKLVSASYRGTYEDCEGVSMSDPNQGLCPLTRKTAAREYPFLLNT